ncbi:MAG: hypothetical protein ACI9J3_001869 [Parvicellaceae bacterium]|jgi:hypothetical protein
MKMFQQINLIALASILVFNSCSSENVNQTTNNNDQVSTVDQIQGLWVGDKAYDYINKTKGAELGFYSDNYWIKGDSLTFMHYPNIGFDKTEYSIEQHDSVFYFDHNEKELRGTDEAGKEQGGTFSILGDTMFMVFLNQRADAEVIFTLIKSEFDPSIIKTLNPNGINRDVLNGNWKLGQKAKCFDSIQHNASDSLSITGDSIYWNGLMHHLDVSNRKFSINNKMYQFEDVNENELWIELNDSTRHAWLLYWRR